jgi:hypothetical protein
MVGLVTIRTNNFWLPEGEGAEGGEDEGGGGAARVRVGRAALGRLISIHFLLYFPLF